MILHILSVIGIVLLCVAAFIVLILLLILFVPVRYCICANGNGSDIFAAVKVKWLFGLLNAKLSYAGDISYRVRILFIPVFKGSFKGEKEEEKLSDKEKKKREKKAAAKALKQEKKELKKQEEKEKKALEKKEMSFKERAIYLCKKAKKLGEKLKTLKYIWDAPVTKRALEFLKLRFFELADHIKPRRIKGHIKFTLSDPFQTAQIYAAAAMLLAGTGADLVLEPDFDGEGIDIENVDISGRIFAGYMLLLGLRIIKNKDVRRVIKYIRRNF